MTLIHCYRHHRQHSLQAGNSKQRHFDTTERINFIITLGEKSVLRAKCLFYSQVLLTRLTPVVKTQSAHF
jgi:hypothetical protein